MDTRSQHENEPSREPRSIFCMPKILPSLTKLLPKPGKYNRGHTMGNDGFANGPMFSRSDPNMNIFIFVCPSAFKFGTV